MESLVIKSTAKIYNWLFKIGSSVSLEGMPKKHSLMAETLQDQRKRQYIEYIKSRVGFSDNSLIFTASDYRKTIK